VFIRGFRVTRTLKIFPKHLIAAAGPSSDPSEDSHETDTGLASFPAITKVKCSLFGISQTSTKLSKYRDPLHILLEHIAEVSSGSPNYGYRFPIRPLIWTQRSPDCDMVLVHDNDLARIGGVLDSHVSIHIHLIFSFVASFLSAVTGVAPIRWNNTSSPQVPAENTANDIRWAPASIATSVILTSTRPHEKTGSVGMNSARKLAQKPLQWLCFPKSTKNGVRSSIDHVKEHA